jgi:hypothetical protein
MTGPRFVTLLLLHRRHFLTRLSALMKLCAFDAVCRHVKIIKVDQVWCGEASEFPDQVTTVFGPGTVDMVAWPADPGHAVSVGQQMVRWGGELLYRQMQACERHCKNVAEGSSFEMSRVVAAGHLDS